MTSQWCQMSPPFNLSPPLIFSLYILFSIYLKAEIYGLYRAWKGKQMLQLTKRITGFYFTAVYLFILGICFLSFFGRNKKSFSIPTPASLWFSLNAHISKLSEFENLENLFKSWTWENLKVFKRQTARLLVFNCSTAGVEDLFSDCCVFTTTDPEFKQ